MSRRATALAPFAVVAALLVAACEPAPAPTTTTTTTTTTTAPTTTTTTAPVDPCAAPVSSGVAGTSTVSTSTTEPLAPADAEAEARTAAAEATDDGSAVSVVAVDPEGRPTITVSDPEDAVAVTGAAVADPILDVVAVEPVEQVQALTVAQAATDPLRAQQWGFDVVGFETPWPCSRGAGVSVAVVDSGVDGTHPDLAGRVDPGVAHLGLAGARPGEGATDPNGHGTHVAGIVAAGAGDGVGIVGVAPESRILPVRVLDATGSGYDVDVARGITWAVDEGATVVNLSLGGPAPSAAIASAIDYAVAREVVVVAAAGNTGAGGAATWPAADPDVIAVASFASGGEISWFSTSGSHIEVTAPGSSILSTLPSGRWGHRSGTSMAAPHVAGVVALLRANRPGDTVAQVRSRLTATATDAGAPGFDASFGHGIISPAAAVLN